MKDMGLSHSLVGFEFEFVAKVGRHPPAALWLWLGLGLGLGLALVLGLLALLGTWLKGNQNRLLLWDYGGQAEFSMSHKYFLGAEGAAFVVVLSLTRQTQNGYQLNGEVMHHMRRWLSVSSVPNRVPQSHSPAA